MGLFLRGGRKGHRCGFGNAPKDHETLNTTAPSSGKSAGYSDCSARVCFSLGSHGTDIWYLIHLDIHDDLQTASGSRDALRLTKHDSET